MQATPHRRGTSPVRQSQPQTFAQTSTRTAQLTAPTLRSCVRVPAAACRKQLLVSYRYLTSRLGMAHGGGRRHDALTGAVSDNRRIGAVDRAVEIHIRAEVLD